MRTKPLFLLGLCILIFSACGTTEHEGPSSSLFNELSSERSGLDFRNQLAPTEELNIITYLYYFNGGGIAAGDINGDGLVDLYFTANQGQDALFINEGGLSFRENTLEAGLSIASDWSSGASFVDIDADGDLDLYVNKVSGIAGLTGSNELYINDGKGHFTESAKKFGLDFSGLATQTAFIDLDGDGDLDAYQLNHSTHDTERRVDTSMRRYPSLTAGDRIYFQNESGTFRDKTNLSGIYQGRLGYGLGIIAVDFSNDFYPELYVSNDFSENDFLYQNLGRGQFEERAKALFEYTSKFSMGNIAADIDSDGELDVLTLDMRPSSDSIRKSSAGDDDPSQFERQKNFGFVEQQARNVLHLSSRGFEHDQAIRYGLHSSDWSWAPVVGDFNLDGRQDIFIANGIWQRPNDLDYLKFSSADAIQRKASNLELASLMPSGLVPNHLYLGSEVLPLKNSAFESGLCCAGSTTSALALDLDNDGDLDLVLNNVNAAAQVFENTILQAKDSSDSVLSITLEGSASNPFSIGAKVHVEAGESWKRVITVQPVTGFQSSLISKTISVGLPNTAENATVRVEWPNGAIAIQENAKGQIKLENKNNTGTNNRSIVRLDSSVDKGASRARLFEDDQLLPLIYVANPTVGRSHSAFFAKVRGVELVDGFLRTGRRKTQVTATYQDADTLYVASLWAPIQKMWVDRRLKLRSTPVSPSGLWTSICDTDDGKLFFENVGYNNLLVEHPGQQFELHIADFDRNGEKDPIAVRVEGSERRTLFGLDEIATQMPTMRKFFTSYLPFSSSSFDEMFPSQPKGNTLVLKAETFRSMIYDKTSGSAIPHVDTVNSPEIGCKQSSEFGQLYLHPLLRGGN